MIAAKIVACVLALIGALAFGITVGLGMILLCMAGTLDDADED